MKKKSILFVSLFIILNSCSPNKKQTKFISEISPKIELSDSTKNIVNAIIDYGEITGSAIGYAGRQPKQWNNFKKLQEDVSEKEIVALTEHTNPVVKCYAFNVLVYKRNKNSFNILKKNLQDTTSVSCQYGCMVSTVKVNDYFIESILRPNPDEAYLTKSDKKTLDSLILYTPNLISNYKNNLLEDIKPEEKYYHRIKELALKNNNAAILAISKYQRKSDIELINLLLENTDTDIQYYGLKAVKNFPNEKSFEKIKTIHALEIKKTTHYNYIMLRELYQAIVSFKNDKSKELLEKTIKESGSYTKKYHSEFIWLALKKNPDEVYNGIHDLLNYSKKEITYLENEFSWQLQ